MSSNARAGTESLPRRTVLKGMAVAATAGALGGAARPVAGAGVDLASWFENTSNFDGVHDHRGEGRVTVSVGAAGNGGAFAFSPAAVRVDPGTTVVWEWTGEGGSHDVAATDEAYGSELVGTAGHTFEHAFEAAGVSRYVCTPHEAMGMKGAVVVGDVEVQSEPEPTPEPVARYTHREPNYGGWFDGVDGYEGTADMRGHRRVRVQVFDDRIHPPALHVDPGTAVVWEFLGEHQHHLAAEDGSYESPTQATGRYALEFDGVGVSRYGCTEHERMRGAVVVGDVYAGTGVLDTTELTVLGLFGVGIVAPTLALGLGRLRRSGGEE